MASLYKRGSIYYIAFHQDGRRIYKSTGKKRKPEALRFLVELKKSLAKRKLVTISAFLKDCMSSKSNGQSWDFVKRRFA
jgi:hypothetical protein